MKKNNFKASQGFSLIELLLVLAIIAALAVAAFVIYPRVQAGRAATYEAQVLSSVQASIKGLFQNGNYFALDNAVAINAKLIPESMVDGTDIINQFAGVVTLAPAADSLGAAPAGTATRAPFYSITYADVPPEVCMKVGSSASSNFAGLTIGTTVVKSSGTGAIEFAEGTLVTACGTDDPVTMIFIGN